MSTTIEAIALLGVCLAPDWLTVGTKVRKCHHPVAETNYCGVCGAQMWVTRRSRLQGFQSALEAEDGKSPYCLFQQDSGSMPYWFGLRLAQVSEDHPRDVAKGTLCLESPGLQETRERIKARLKEWGLAPAHVEEAMKSFNLHLILRWS